MSCAANDTNPNTRLLLADDHALVRAGIRGLLEDIPGLEVVAEATDGLEALSLIEQHQPDLVILDISMPYMSGLEVLEKTSKLYPGMRVIMLTAHDDGEIAQYAFSLGAIGYISKSAAATDLPLAIQLALDGKVFDSLRPRPRSTAPSEETTKPDRVQLHQLTADQVQILKLLVDGHNTKSIATTLDISVKTAETRRTQLMERLDIYDVAGLVRYAIRIGLITA